MKKLKEFIIEEGFLRKNLGLGKDVLIKKWLDGRLIENYTINPDFTIDVNDDIGLSFYGEGQLPDYIQFGTVTGYFVISDSRITSLRGCPLKVGGRFVCSHCENLTSLEGAPQEVGGDFWCNNCSKLKSLEGAPQKIGGSFDCSCCEELKSLKGSPKTIPSYFQCYECPELKSLRGAPKEVGGDFDCMDCGKLFDFDDVKKVSKVKGSIFV